MSCLFDNFQVVSIDVMIKTYPFIICNFLKIYMIPYAEYKNVIYTPNGITKKWLRNVCKCKDYLFELNLLYYIYQANECLLFKGKIRTQVLSSSQKKIIVSIKNSGDLKNVNINQKQSTKTTVEMVNTSDPSVQNSMQGIYLQSLMGVIKAFDDRGVPKLVQFKDPELEENIFNLSGYRKVSYEKNNDDENEKEKKTKLGLFTLHDYFKEDDDNEISQSSYEYMESAFDKQIREDFQVVLKNMMMDKQVIFFQIDEVDARRYNINLDQESIQNIMIKQVSDGLLDKFFQNIFIKSNKYNCQVNTYPVNNLNPLKSQNKVVFYTTISLIISLVIIIISLVLYYSLR